MEVSLRYQQQRYVALTNKVSKQTQVITTSTDWKACAPIATLLQNKAMSLSESFACDHQIK